MITFVLTAAVIYFVVAVPMRRLAERRARGHEPGPASPTDLELLVEIRDLLRAQEGFDPVDPPRGRHSTAPPTGDAA